MCDEGGLFFIFFLHWDLVVSLSSINEAIILVTSCGVYQLVNYRQWIAVFRACLVEVCIVDTYLVFPVCFFTSTTLATHSGCVTSQINLTFSSFFVFSAISFYLSYTNFLFFLDHWLYYQLDVQTV